MATSSSLRLDRLARQLRPVGCYSDGPVCEAAVVVGDETPSEPDLPARCPDCRRPRVYQVVRVVGVDAKLI